MEWPYGHVLAPRCGDIHQHIPEWLGRCKLDLKSTVVGWWKPSMCHINELELWAINKMLYAF